MAQFRSDPGGPPMLETKFMSFDRTEALERGIVEGYATLFDVADQSGDVVAPGAFAASLGALAAAGRSVKFLWQHDPAEPIGVWDEVAEDGRGLKLRGRLLEEVTRGREARALLEAGAVDGLSIGYRTVRAEKIASGGRRILELELWEVSLVTFPMLPDARAVARSDAEDVAIGLMEALDEARTLFA